MLLSQCMDYLRPNKLGVYIGATPIRVWVYLHTYIVALNKYDNRLISRSVARLV